MAQLCHNKCKIAISFSPFTWLHFLAIFRKAPPNSTPYSFRKKEVRSRINQDQVGRVWSVLAKTRGQTRQKPPGNNLLSGSDALLHAKPKRQLQGWDAHREISAKAQPYVSAGADTANTAL